MSGAGSASGATAGSFEPTGGGAGQVTSGTSKRHCTSVLGSMSSSTQPAKASACKTTSMCGAYQDRCASTSVARSTDVDTSGLAEIGATVVRASACTFAHTG